MTHNPAEALREALGLGKKFDIEETLARAIFNDQHRGLQNCYDWDTAGLDDEHPGTSERYRGYAQSAIKTLAVVAKNMPEGCDAQKQLQSAARICAAYAAGYIIPAITPPPSPDVAGVVERLRQKRTRVHDLGGVGFEVDPDCEEAATLLESLSADKGRMKQDAARLDFEVSRLKRESDGNRDRWQSAVAGLKEIITAKLTEIEKLREALTEISCPTHTVIEEIAAERRRQIEAEGWTPEHDDTHNKGELAKAAACYAVGQRVGGISSGTPWSLWPWADEWWKPKDRRRNLIRAAALIVAEIERLDRASPTATRSEKENAG